MAQAGCQGGEGVDVAAKAAVDANTVSFCLGKGKL